MTWWELNRTLGVKMEQQATQSILKAGKHFLYIVLSISCQFHMYPNLFLGSRLEILPSIYIFVETPGQSYEDSDDRNLQLRYLNIEQNTPCIAVAVYSCRYLAFILCQIIIKSASQPQSRCTADNKRIDAAYPGNRFKRQRYHIGRTYNQEISLRVARSFPVIYAI